MCTMYLYICTSRPVYGCSQPRELWFIDFSHVYKSSKAKQPYQPDKQIKNERDVHNYMHMYITISVPITCMFALHVGFHPYVSLLLVYMYMLCTSFP